MVIQSYRQYERMSDYEIQTFDLVGVGSDDGSYAGADVGGGS